MKPEYIGKNGLMIALNDLKKDINSNLENDTKILTTEFVRLNDPNVAEDTGQLKSDIFQDTDYTAGVVQAFTPYFVFVYYGTEKMPAGGNTGEPRVFEYTWNENQEHFEELWLKLIDEHI